MALTDTPDGNRSDDDRTPTSVCVVIVLYDNPLDELWRCLRAVRRAVEFALDDWRVAPSVVRISMGDCSDHPLISDGDLDALRDGLDARITVSYRWFAKNLRHSAACNALADGALEDALLILNPDTYLAPRSLARLLTSLRSPDVSAADARQVPCEHPKWYDPVVGDQSWASGACMLVRTPRFHEVEGFDAETFPSYANDVDLSWRLRLHGGRVLHQPRAVVFHDKRLDQLASVKPTRTELYEGLLGKLLLATKYDRDDIASDTIELVRAHGTDEQKRAVKDFELRRDQEMLPMRVGQSGAVAEFIDGDYGKKQY